MSNPDLRIRNVTPALRIRIRRAAEDRELTVAMFLEHLMNALDACKAKGDLK